MPAESDGQKKDEPTVLAAESKSDAIKNPETDHNESDKPATAPAKSTAEAIKVWSDAIFALMKLALLATVGALLIVASGIAIWRDLHQQLINVNIDPQAEKLLLDHGIYFDLRSMLVDQVNARIYGVNEIVRSQAFRSQAFEDVLPTENSEAVSFKPFGLDISTDYIMSLVRNVFGGSPEFEVQVGMMCSPSPCGEAITADSPASAAQQLTLRVKLQGPANIEPLTFPLTGGSFGLRRGLRDAMDKTSEKVLELADPLRASVLYLNEPQSMVFEDEQMKYWNMAAGTTFAPSARGEAGRCVAEVVFGCSAFFRGDPQWFDILSRVGTSPDASDTCKIQAQTDIAIYADDIALCGSPDGRMPWISEASTALEGLKIIKRRAMSHDEHSRIVALEIQTEIIEAFSKLVDEGSGTLLCGTDGPATNVQPKAKRYARLIPLIDGLPARVPHDLDNASIHAVVGLLSQVQQKIATRGDLWSRVAVSSAILKLIDPYLHSNDSHPRLLFLAQGRALMEMALAAFEAQSLPHDEKMDQSLQGAISSINSNLWAATVAFENAAATSSVSPLTEPFSDLEPTVMLADVLYLRGNENGAKAAYAAAAHKFTEEDEPHDEMVWLAKAAARWASILVEEGACKSQPARDQDWDAVWSPLGAAKDNDLCLLTRADPPPPPELGKFGMLQVVYPLISESVRQCAHTEAGAPDENTAEARRVKLLACLKTTGPDSAYSVERDLSSRSSGSIDRQIADAFDQGPAPQLTESMTAGQTTLRDHR